MQIPTWLYTLLISSTLIGAFLFTTWVLGTMLDDILDMKRQKQFEEDLRLAIKHSQPSWEHLSNIASTRNIKNTDVYRILQKLLREILTGRESDLVSHQNVVEGYLAKIKEIEPFEGIPTEIRIHLERIKEQLSNDIMLMQPLTGQIQDLLSVNEKEKRQQKYYTVGGFFVGFVGLIFAAFAYIYPCSNSVPAETIPNKSTPSAAETGAEKPSNPSLQRGAD